MEYRPKISKLIMFLNNIMDQNILLGISSVLLMVIVYFRERSVKYSLMMFYIAVNMYGFYYANRKLSLASIFVLVLVYLFIAKPPVNVENFEGDSPEDSKEEDAPEDSKEEEDDSSDDEDEEKGIEQFSLEDKFSELHKMIHEIQDQAKSIKQKH